MIIQPVARSVVVEPFGPETFLTFWIRWEQIVSGAESNSKNLSEIDILDDADEDDGNLCLHVEVLHALEVLHCKADVVKLYREADLAKIRMSVTRPFKKSLGANTKMIFKAIDYHGLQGQLVRNNYENEHRDQIRSIYAPCCNMMMKNQSDPSFQYDNDRWRRIRPIFFPPRGWALSRGMSRPQRRLKSLSRSATTSLASL